MNLKKLLIIGFVFITYFSFLAQECDSVVRIKDKTIVPHSFEKVGALVSYYFWEEDSLGFIVNQTIKKPFYQNYFIECTLPNKAKDTIGYNNLCEIIQSFAHEKKHKNGEIDEKNHFELQKDLIKEKKNFPMRREEALIRGSVIHINQNGNWISKRRHSVLYFTILPNNKWKFYYSSDSIVLHKYKVRLPSNGQYMVLTYLKGEKKIDHQVVYNYSGENVTEFFLHAKTMEPQRVIVFANGYRGPTRDKDESDNLVTQKDRYYYWFKIDNQFIERLHSDAAYYIDGSMGIYTSNHRTMAGFAVSMFRSSNFFRKKRARENYKCLNTEANIEGFNIRKEKGRIAAKAFLSALCNSPACRETIDTVDIVCHSMGYAYSLGFIEELKGKVVFGKMYVIAAESACADSADWNMFEEVWQYGSNLDQENPDPIWQQDGVAPQCKLKGIECLPPNRGGRAFIPSDWPKKNFIDSHQLYNYDWMFERIKKGEPGYIGS